MIQIYYMSVVFSKTLTEKSTLNYQIWFNGLGQKKIPLNINKADTIIFRSPTKQITK